MEVRGKKQTNDANLPASPGEIRWLRLLGDEIQRASAAPITDRLRGLNRTCLRRLAVVVVQQPTEPLAAADFACRRRLAQSQRPIVLPLVRPFRVVVGQELAHYTVSSS